MKKYLLPETGNFYKANLHCHSTISDGRLTPEELKEAYKNAGYQVLAITDHCSPHPHNDLTDDEFLLLTGYEAYIRPDKNGNYNAFAPEVHLNLFAKDPKNETLICYNRGSCIVNIISSGNKEVFTCARASPASAR